MTESEDPTSFADPDGVERDENDATLLDDLPDGAGCAEIWTYLSDRRRRDCADGTQSD